MLFAKESADCAKDPEEGDAAVFADLADYILERSYMSWYASGARAKALKVEQVCAWLKELKGWTKDAQDAQSAALVVGASPSGLSAALELMRRHKFKKAKPLVVVNDRDSRELVHVVSLTTPVLENDKFDKMHTPDSPARAMRDLVRELGLGKLFPDVEEMLKKENFNIVRLPWALLTNFLLACTRVLKYEGVVIRQHVEVKQGDGPEVEKVYDFDAIRDDLRGTHDSKAALTLFAKGDTVRAATKTGVVFEPDRVFFSFGGGAARAPVVKWATDKGLIKNVDLKPALLMKKADNGYGDSKGQLFFAIVMQGDDCKKWGDKYTKDFETWKTNAGKSLHDKVFAKKADIGDLCHLELGLSPPAQCHQDDTVCANLKAYAGGKMLKREADAEIAVPEDEKREDELKKAEHLALAIVNLAFKSENFEDIVKAAVQVCCAHRC